jgi:oxygen-dependent protoporphyrinogen oxidase
MIGRLNPQKKHVDVIGAGISGLLAAYQCKKKGYHVRIFESQNKVGGMLASVPTKFGLSEMAAHSLLASDLVEKLFSDLGLVLLPLKNKKKFILRDQKLRAMPLTPFEIFKTFLRAVYSIQGKKQSMTVQHWAERFLGQPVLSYLISPMLLGIYGARPDEIILPLAFPSLDIPSGHSLLSWGVYNSFGRLFQKKSSAQMKAPEKGFGSLIDALFSYLKDDMVFEHRQDIDPSCNTIIATNAMHAATLLEKSRPGLAQALKSISYRSLVSATVFLSSSQAKKIPRGIGVLVPSCEKKPILGILFNSFSFDCRKSTDEWESFTFMFGGSDFADVIGYNDDQINALISEQFSSLFQIRSPQFYSVIYRWPFAVPLYDWKLDLAREQLQKKLHGEDLVLFSTYTKSIGIRGLIEQSFDF